MPRDFNNLQCSQWFSLCSMSHSKERNGLPLSMASSLRAKVIEGALVCQSLIYCATFVWPACVRVRPHFGDCVVPAFDPKQVVQCSKPGRRSRCKDAPLSPFFGSECLSIRCILETLITKLQHRLVEIICLPA